MQSKNNKTIYTNKFKGITQRKVGQFLVILAAFFQGQTTPSVKSLLLEDFVPIT